MVYNDRRIPSMHALETRRLRSATFFVANTGSDSAGDGSSASPFETLQHAANLTHPGDTVIAEPGSYAGFILGWDDPQAGAPDAPITFRALPGASIVRRNNKTPDGIDLEPGNDFINIIGFDITNTAGDITRAAIRVCSSDHVAIQQNICDGAGTWGIFTSHSNDTLIQDNVTRRSITQHGIYVSNSADHPVITGNTVYDNAGCGIHLNGDLSEGGLGLITKAVIENNIIYGNGARGGSAINGDGLTNSLIENNLLYDNHASGISLFQSDASAGATGNTIVNNTILMASDARWAININSASTSNCLFNNILFNANPAHGAIDITSDSLAGFTSDNNLVDSRFAVDDDPITLSNWQLQSSQDAHSVLSLTDPFANRVQNDFHLSCGSSAAGLGQVQYFDHAAPITDLDQNRRMSGHVDAGAFQLDFALVADPLDSSKEDWIAHGSSAADSIHVIRSAPGVVSLVMNGVDRGDMPIDVLANVQIFGAGGADTILSTADVLVPLLIRGGRGSDSIVGATDHDTLAGCRGCDTLTATGGASLLIGGKGSDLITASADDALGGISTLQDTIQGGIAFAA